MSSKTSRLRGRAFPLSYVGRECAYEILGQTWRFSRWELHVLDSWIEWARTQLPDPIERCTKVIERMMVEEEKITDAAVLMRRNKIKDELVHAAMKQANCYLAFNSPEVQSLIQSPRGAAELLRLLLVKHHPDITRDQAFALVQAMPANMLQEIMETTAGRTPPGQKNSRPRRRAGPAGATSALQPRKVDAGEEPGNGQAVGDRQLDPGGDRAVS